MLTSLGSFLSHKFLYSNIFKSFVIKLFNDFENALWLKTTRINLLDAESTESTGEEHSRRAVSKTVGCVSNRDIL